MKIPKKVASWMTTGGLVAAAGLFVGGTFYLGYEKSDIRENSNEMKRLDEISKDKQRLGIELGMYCTTDKKGIFNSECEELGYGYAALQQEEWRIYDSPAYSDLRAELDDVDNIFLYSGFGALGCLSFAFIGMIAYGRRIDEELEDVKEPEIEESSKMRIEVPVRIYGYGNFEEKLGDFDQKFRNKYGELHHHLLEKLVIEEMEEESREFEKRNS